MKQYLFNILVAIDQLVNAICFGNPDETISSRVYREHHSFIRKCIDWIFLTLFKVRNHCKKAFLAEKQFK